MIPKRVFYVWGANDPYKRDMLACIQSWREILHDYEIVEINENSIEYFNFKRELQNNRWFRTVYEKKMWAYIADYVRIKTLYDNGGIYFDTDVSVLKRMDKFLDENCFVGIQSSGTWNYTEPAILGAQKGNTFLCEILKFYDKGIWTEPIYTIPQIFEKFLQERHNLFKFPPKKEQTIINLGEITLYPERFFIPFEFGQQFTPECVETDTHTIHWFGGSWCKPEIEFWLRHKHLEKIPEYQTKKKVALLGFIPLYITRSEYSFQITFGKLINLFKKVRTDTKVSFYLFGVLFFTVRKNI